MTDSIKAKMLLTDKSCLTCKRDKVVRKGETLCHRYLGECIGWQFWPCDKSGVCGSWKR